MIRLKVRYSVQHRPYNLQDCDVPLQNCQMVCSTYIAPGVPGPWLGLRQKSVDAEYHCAKEHKLGHATHGLDKGLAPYTLFPSRVNSRDVGNGKL
jgi:hypothetical protein